MTADGPLLSSLVEVMGAIRHAELSTVPVALADLVSLIEQQIPVVNYAGIAVPARRVERTPAAVITEHPVIAMLHDAEHHGGGGPARDAASSQDTVLVADLTVEGRWPQFTREAARVTSVRSIAALPMHYDRFVLGVLILAAERPEAFDATVLADAADLAALAAGAWSAVVREEQLRRALSSRDDIGQAKGILMERFSITADAAFALLRQLSQESNTPLLDIAQHLIVTVTNGDVST